MKGHIWNAADEISSIRVGTGYESVTIGITAALEAARALDAAGLLATPERDAAVAAEALPVDGCACTPHVQDAGGGYTEYLLEYEPACPEHSEHLWDPKQGEWVLRSERDAEVQADERAKVLDRNAVLRAWTNAGPRPDVHKRAKDVVRKTMPVLARALDEGERGLT